VSPARPLARYVARYRLRYASGVGCLATATLLSLLIPRTVQHAVEALETNAAAPVAGFVGLILLIALGNGIARLASRFLIVGSAQRVEADVRDALYGSLLRFPPDFYARHAIGDLMARASSDVSAVRSLVGFGGVSLISTVLAFVGAVGAMIAVDPWLTLWALAPYPLLALLAKSANVAIHERTQAAQEQLGVLSARVQETLAGIGVVRGYTMEAQTTAEFDRANREHLARTAALARTLSAFVPLSGLISGVGALIALWLGGRAVMEGRLTLGALVAFNGYLAYLAWPTMALGFTISLARRGLTSMARIQEIIAAAPPIGRPEPAFAGAPSIRFAGLTFAYEGRPPALSNVSFTVAPGEMVAVVGPTGSGKSTLGALLARLWEPPAGTVFVGDRDVTTMSLATLRAVLGYVPQEAFLFSRSIHANVTLGREGVSRETAEAAAVVAGIAEEVRAFEAGWDTVVGERGLTVSGGQRQRLALARALAGAPPMLVLDDVFASVDAAKEAEITDALRRAATGRTVLLMTHRLRAARAADRVVVLVDGRVAESGPHDELVAAAGPYAQLWRIQQLEEEIARA
jgi:ATP-binding cassette, subfamily B, multidrug efflux pump